MKPARAVVVAGWVTAALSGLLVVLFGHMLTVVARLEAENAAVAPMAKQLGLAPPVSLASLQPMLIRSVAIGLVGLVVGIGLIARRSWGRMLGVAFAAFLILVSLFDLVQFATQGVFSTELALNRCAWIVMGAALWQVLTRPGAKTVFKRNSWNSGDRIRD